MNAAIIEKAPAKINLYLHVTGKREDGYHLLDSLVVFANKGDAGSDVVRLTPADAYTLYIDGPFGAGLNAEDSANNLITKAILGAAEKLQKTPNFRIHLTKNLPLASGIGGGSADAAAALRAAAQFWGVPKNHPALFDVASRIGSDVSACLMGRPLFFSGTGNVIDLVERIPSMAMLLINPRIPLPTAPVFKARQGAFTDKPRMVVPDKVDTFISLLQHYRNDLEPPALSLCQAIGDVLDSLRAEEGCVLARLSGSGATCFGLFKTENEAVRAAQNIHRKIGEWWMAVTGF